ncbi:E3 ubiquitin-protein ligase RBBP6 [Drosophila biarmipes]|uniref:E3 ubiquitin-protein ligase RBBP6 n=1 Tax=Drosophila biarmipes TaxID=125945 RepID=UPI0007E71B88|nr:E3 ubiquitin-protein ligase RBBP6 [Drosophila biarmipes]XP_050743079.1 E3 ubiquitin-protein ligase RBBP6 [Drosophila biarmipes]
MSVHYKFKSTLNFDTITFDGLHISVGDLKREIVQQKRLGKVIDFDLQITNAQSKEEYKDDGVLIPKNTTLIISRIPIAHPTKKGWEPPAAENAFSTAPSKQDNFNMDLSKMQGTEEDKIQAMMMQSTVDYDPKTYHRIKGQSQVGEVPASYRCNKCKKSGHWIKNCPFVTGKDQQEVKRNTGIPRSFRDKPDAAENESSDFVLPAVQNQEIPEDLICGICRDIFVDAVMIPCCGSSFCDDCVRTSLLESEDSECPDCKEKNCSPGSLIPNRFLRNSVNAFKNETGYNKSAVKSAPAPVKNDEKPPVEKEVEEKPLKEEAPQEAEVKADKQEETETNGKKPKKSESPEPPSTAEPTQKEKDKYDSDYEDNITIKMPQPAAEPASVPSKRSPTYSHRSSESSHRRERSDYVSDHDHKHHRPSKSESSNKDRSLLPTPIGTVPSYQGHMMNEAEDARRSSAYKPPYMPMQRGPPPMHMMGHHMPAYNNGYNNMGQRPPLSYVPYQNQSVHPMRTPYGSAGGNMNMNMSQPFQSPNLASIYQGVAAKVGSGLIDDPLEAFNRIMKEKERKKVDRFRSSDRHRSRSPDRQRHRFKSPMYEKDSLRDSLKEKRPRSRERKREHSYERHIRHPRSSRQPNDGSKSPGGRIKRSSHRRSASPKPAYKSDYRDKPYNKPFTPKPEPVEPPPPGFEPLQLQEEDDYKNKHLANSEASHGSSSKGGSHKKGGEEARHEEVPRKRHRSRSRSKEPKPADSSHRSLTPPAKITTPKMTAAQLRERECSPKTPERALDEYLPAKARVIASQPAIDDSEVGPNVGKENKVKSPSSKERKKKKKDKAERKKNKKDKRAKKEKGERQKKSSSLNRSDSDLNNSSLVNETTFKILTSPRASPTFEIEAALSSPARNASENPNPKKSQSYLNVDVASDDNLGSRSKRSEASSVSLSKWELEENNLGLEDSSKKSAATLDDQSEITSDVLRKAENAIFAKAINAIRPVEFQVIINSKDSSKDRSVIRNDKDRSPSPRRTSNKSVKERLGNKVARDRSRSPDKSKGRRREAVGKNSDDDASRNRSDRHGSRKRDNRSRDRSAPSEKRQDRSYKRSTPEDDRSRRPYKERSDSRPAKHDQINSDDSDRRAGRNTKSSPGRVVSSVTAVAGPPKPCRPDNPFRKFVDNSSSSSLVVKYDNTIQNDGASSDNSMEHRKPKDKKLKKHAKYSSTESLRSEKRKDLKSKKKSKVLKKKKKSKK